MANTLKKNLDSSNKENLRRSHKQVLMKEWTLLSKSTEFVIQQNRELMDELKEEIESRSQVLETLALKIDTQNKQSSDLALEISGAQEQIFSELMALKSENALAQKYSDSIMPEVEVLEAEVLDINLQTQSLQDEKSRILNLIQEFNNRNTSLDQKVLEGSSLYQDKCSEHQNLSNNIAELQNQRLGILQELKTVNNTLQQLKGNIRVFCRVRPSASGVPSKIDTNDREVFVPETKEHSFYFDKVFSSSASQETVFEEISQLVQSALDGYNVCVFAYGQTGSGKTYTMEGPGGVNLSLQDLEYNKGVIQRSGEQLFATREDMKLYGWNFSFMGSCIEIYNEEVRDLLENGSKITAFSTNLINPTAVELHSYKDLTAILAKARHYRKQAQTLCNLHSSRSHFIVQIRIYGQRDQEKSHGILNIIDLAGSERLKHSKAEGERLEETKAINKSLSALGDVIHALINKENHVPFRNSKLTTILQNCMGGDGKTLMFVNISPDEADAKQTLCSLRFAQKVTACTVK